MCPILILSTLIAIWLLNISFLWDFGQNFCEYLTYSSSLTHIAHAENPTFLTLTGQVMSIEDYKLWNSRVSRQPFACFCFSYLRIQFIPRSINSTTLSNHMLSISSLSWLDNDIFKRLIIIVFPCLCMEPVWSTAVRLVVSQQGTAWHPLVLTALGGKRSFLESIGTAPLSADMLFLKPTSI